MTLEELTMQMTQIKERIARNEEKSEAMERRLKDVETSQSGITEIRILIERMNMSSESMKNSLADINSRLDKLDQKLSKRIELIEAKLAAQEQKPAEKWDKAKWIVVTAILTGVAGYLLKSILP